MRHYELKNKERQEALEKALPGFKEECRRKCEGLDGHLDEGTPVMFSTVNFDAASWTRNEWSLVIPADNLEVIEEYDPKKWNKFPLVKPPRGILMRAEGRYRYGGKFIGAAVWDMGRWLPMEPMVGPEDVAIERFRPWDEEKES